MHGTVPLSLNELNSTRYHKQETPQCIRQNTHRNSISVTSQAITSRPCYACNRKTSDKLMLLVLSLQQSFADAPVLRCERCGRHEGDGVRTAVMGKLSFLSPPLPTFPVSLGA